MLACEGCEQPTSVLVVMLEEGEISHLCMTCFVAYCITMAETAQARVADGGRQFERWPGQLSEIPGPS